MSRPRAYQLIDAAQVVGNLSTMVDIPKAERQVRPLTSLPPEAQPIVWQRAVETMEILTPTGVIPKAESVVRPLTSLPAEEQPIVWRLWGWTFCPTWKPKQG